MDYQVRIVDDGELACEWAVVHYAGTAFLFVARGSDSPRVRAEAMRHARNRAFRRGAALTG